MSYEQYTVDQLVDAATELNDRVDTLFTTLAGITATATAEGIEATVNLEGRLVALRLSRTAVTLPPQTLAAEIFRLTQEASATALAEGFQALPPVLGHDLTDELRALAQPRPHPAVEEPPAPEPPRDTDDFSTIQSWAVPH